MSLRLRVVAAIALVLLTASVVGTALAGWQARLVLREELVAALAGGRQTLTGALETLETSRNPGLALNGLVEAFNGNRHLVATLIAADGRPAAISRPLPVRAAPDWFSALFRPDVGVVSLPVLAPGFRRLVLTPVFANDVAGIWAEFIALVGVLAGAFLVGALLVWLTVGRALRPLSDFSAAFVRIGSGDYGARVRQAGPLELVRLGRGVNDMAGRLAAMQEKTHALEDQLRTLQDEERADLARDLHDELGPHLFAANVDATMARRLIAEGNSAEALRQVEAISESVSHMQRLVRDILGRLRPTELIELGLRAAVDELVTFWAARHPSIRFSVLVPDDDALPMPDAARETLYRVVQEGLNNAVRHGRPGRIDIEIGRDDAGDVFARITDDGRAADKPQGAGFGLIGMRERVAASRGRLTITPGAGGWSVTACLPAAADDLVEGQIP
jgi:two-component system sensor histidine kinase UhpB